MPEIVNKKLIEVSIPLDAINKQAAREKKSIRKAHPSMIHLYWARRPVTAARAILLAQLIDDPGSHPERFPTVEAQDVERRRLHKLIEDLTVWENGNNSELLELARTEIRNSNGGKLPSVLDPFAGGGSIPLEAQRLGLESFASDLNPLAVLINRALIEIAPKFRDMPPVFPGVSSNSNIWTGAEGLAEDVKEYGLLLRELAREKIGHLYPSVKAPGGTEHNVIAWIWARTVVSPNPANPVSTPLVRSWWLSKKKGHEAYLVPHVDGPDIAYEVRNDSLGPTGEDEGTMGRRGGKAIGDGTPLTLPYVRAEGKAGRLGRELIAIVAEGPKGKIYLPPTKEQSEVANVPMPEHYPDAEIAGNPRNFNTKTYGLNKFSDLFTSRQLVALTTFSDLISEIRERALADALSAGMSEGESLEQGGGGAVAYADAIATYLGLAVSRQTNSTSSICGWDSSLQKIRNVFSRQAIPMTWDYAEVNVFSKWSGGFLTQIEGIVDSIKLLPTSIQGHVSQDDATTRDYSGSVISTDPPYYDNIGYADLSDYFYVWLKESLGDVHSKTLTTVLTPKTDELIANPYRHDGKEGAERFFVEGFNRVFSQIRETGDTTAPLTVYYAYKQQETNKDGTSSTGWHTLLDGLIRSGWEITATWPLETEMSDRLISAGANALASSIVLACRPRPKSAEATTRRHFLTTLKSELPEALRTLIQGSVAPVDLAQAAIGPGMAVFSRFARVREADGSDMSVKEALLLINSALDEVLNEQESDFDPDTRFAVKWYRQFGWDEASSGIADQLARSSDTSITEMERGGIFKTSAGKARLIGPDHLAEDWDPTTDDRISIWECVVRLAAIMSKSGAEKVATLLPGVEARVGLDPVKELGFLLFHEAEKKSDSKDAILFNGLVGAWSDLKQQARKFAESPEPGMQMTFDFDDQGD